LRRSELKQPDVSAPVTGRVSKFSIDRLVRPRCPRGSFGRNDWWQPIPLLSNLPQRQISGVYPRHRTPRRSLGLFKISYSISPRAIPISI